MTHELAALIWILPWVLIPFVGTLFAGLGAAYTRYLMTHDPRFAQDLHLLYIGPAHEKERIGEW